MKPVSTPVHVPVARTFALPSTRSAEASLAVDRFAAAPPPSGTSPLPASPSSQAAASPPLRDPQAAVRFCDTFNAGIGLAPRDLDEKIGLMRTSPLKLARCMPALFMSDLLTSYADVGKLSDRPAPVIWIQGDCHLGNFGIVQSRHGHAVWGLNDFDMTCKGSPAMDLDRLAFSIAAAMKERGLSEEDVSRTVKKLARSYADEIHDIANGRDDGEAYLNAKQADGQVRDLIENSAAVTREQWIKKYASQGADGRWTFIPSDEVQPVDARTSKAVSDALHTYDQGQAATPAVVRPLHILGIAQKMQSGGSSHGQPRYFALVENADPHAPPIILEVKQELPAPLVGYTGDNAAAVRASKRNWSGDPRLGDAAQVAAGQRQMGGDQNPLTGSVGIDGISYLVREREPCKATLSDKHLRDVGDFRSLAEQAGTVLALAHGRGREQATAVQKWIGGDGDAFADRLEAFATAYSRQADADLDAFRAAHPLAAGPLLADTAD